MPSVLLTDAIHRILRFGICHRLYQFRYKCWIYMKYTDSVVENFQTKEFSENCIHITIGIGRCFDWGGGGQHFY